ncbi:hypothetical protein MVEN_01617800 [Mycena venus]|uniref:Tat pathway signal sequence n=1 Tax=Mycena venus TaxID=2733690 RepID=A0A8H6XR37_9AGAR|nr:hypothetical protein MVEN_01617800 [Mycena venus]
MASSYYIPLEEPSRRGLHSRMLNVFLVLSAILNLALLCFFTLTNRPVFDGFQDVPYVYSPAENVVRYKTIKFTRGFLDEISIYERDPSAAVDNAWRNLHSFERTKMSTSEAMRMLNTTWPLEREPGQYMFALDVFHQLHCLDVLRKEVYRDYGYKHVPMNHIRHCVGAIRQALMCAADISPIVWQWSEKGQIVERRDDILHVCRDFDQIRDWASERTWRAMESDFHVHGKNNSTVAVESG